MPFWLFLQEKDFGMQVNHACVVQNMINFDNENHFALNYRCAHRIVTPKPLLWFKRQFVARLKSLHNLSLVVKFMSVLNFWRIDSCIFFFENRSAALQYQTHAQTQKTKIVPMFSAASRKVFFFYCLQACLGDAGTLILSWGL